MAFDIERFKQYVRKHLGIELPNQSQRSLEAFLLSRFNAYQFEDVSRHVKKLLEEDFSRLEFGKLVDALTNGKTSFFRHPDQLTELSELIAARDRDRNRPVAIWSAGCSSGEEVYTLRMIFEQKSIETEILGTDVDQMAIDVAKQGIYDAWKLASVNPQTIDRYFETVHKTQYRFLCDRKENIEFRQHNLMDDGYPVPSTGRWDIILCRNVLIYFAREPLVRVIDKFTDVLNSDGVFLLSPSESLHGINENFELIKHRVNYFYHLVSGGNRRPKSSLGVATDTIPSLFPTNNGQSGTYSTITPLSSVLPYEEVKIVRTDRDIPAGDLGAKGIETREDSEALSECSKKLDRAVELFQSGDRDFAIGLLKKCADEFPESFDTRLTLANGLAYLKQMDRAEEQYAMALDCDPFSPEIHFLFGMFYRKNRDWAQSIRRFKNALFLNNAFWLVSFYLAGVFMKQNKRLQAKREYESALYHITTNSKPPFKFMSKLHGMEKTLNFKEDIRELCKKNITNIAQNIR